MTIEELILVYICMIAVGSALFWEVYWFIRSLLFYRNNGWDFSVDFGPKIYRGESTEPEFEMAPREKMLIGHPVGIFVWAGLLASCVAIILIHS